MKTNNTVINSIMRKCICTVLITLYASLSAWGVVYQKVTDLSTLSTGDQVILTNNIAATSSGQAMSKTVSGQYYGQVAVSSSSNKISYSGSDIMVLTVKKNGSGNLIAFWTGDGWLYDDGSNNHLKVNSGSWSSGIASGQNWVWGFALSSGSNPNSCVDLLNEKARADNSNRWLQYNTNGFKSSSTYSVYANLCIWKVACTSPFGSLSVGGGSTVTWSGSPISKSVSLSGKKGSGAVTWSFVGSVPSSVATISGSASSATVTINGVGGEQSKTLTVKCAIAANGDYCEEEQTIDITVNAQSYTYTYKANGGTPVADQTQTVYHGKSTTLKANNTFTAPSCKQFSEWNSNSSGTGTHYNAGASITPTSNLTFFAIWSDLGPYTVTATSSPAAGGTATIGGETSKSCACGATGIALAATPNSGYYFNGWTKSPNSAAGGTIADASSASTNYSTGSGAATLTANFLPYLHVTYNANGGSGAPTDANNYVKNANVSISNSIPTNSGYTFRGWATSESRANAGTVDYMQNQSSAFQITADTELWAVWCKTITGASLTVSGTEPTFNYSTGKGSTTFLWGSVTGATAYNLTISNTTDGTDVYTGAVSASSSYEFTNMIPGKTYRATVTASNACTETSGNVEKSIDCPAMAGTPTITLPGTIGQTSVTITFSQTNAVSFSVWLTNGNGSSDLGTIAVAAEEIAATAGVASKTFSISADQYYYVHATGKNICGNVSSENSDDFQAGHEATYDTYQFACVDFAATVPSGKAYVTSGNGKTILAKHPVHLVITGAFPNHYVDIDPSDDNISVYFVKDDKFQVVNASNQLRIAADGSFAKDIYFAYTPSAAGDGSVTAPTFTVRCDGFEQTFNADGSLLKVRAMPDNFAIIAKSGNAWDILPADMGNTNGTQPAAAVRVDDNSCPTKAYTEEADNAFRIWPIDVSGANRFKSMAAGENGSIIRLSMPNNSNYAFGSNNSSSTEIGAFYNTQITASNAGAGANFYWDVTTTEEVVGGNTYFKYTLKNPQRDRFLTLNGKKWGMYDSGIQEVHFVPIEDTKDAELTAMEWAPSQVALRYPGTGTLTLTSAAVDGAALGSARMERLGTSDLYILSDVTLQANPSKALQVVVEEDVSGVKTSKESILTIPFIITDTKNNTALRDMMDGADADAKYAIAKTVDVVVRKGGQFETTDGNGKFNDLYIYPGGKANLANNITIQNIYLRGGFCWLSSEFALPQMKTTDGISISGLGNSGNGVYYDLYLDNNPYMMALPKDIALSAVTNEEGTDDWNAWVKGYSGEGRTKTPKESGWIYAWNISPGTHLYRGKGYEIGISPRKNRPYGILRFPLQQSSVWANETACAPEVVAWGMTGGELDEGITANNAGWNFVGNPFFTAYNNSGTDAIIIASGLTEKLDDNGNWTGKYDWVESEKVKYFTIPQYTYDEYDDVRSVPYKLDAFYPFFVQVNAGTKASPASLAFGTENRALKMPKRYSYKTMLREVIVDFSLTDELENSDVAGLSISDIYSAAFDEDDKEKTIKNGTQFMKVYTMVGDYRVAFNSLPEEKAAQPIPVGYIAPEAGYYTFALPEDIDASEIEHVWLTDYEKSTQVDLLAEDYLFYSAQGQYEERFAINAILKIKGTATDLEGVDADDNQTERPFKFIYRDQMYILLNGVIYDATGKRVQTINK